MNAPYVLSLEDHTKLLGTLTRIKVLAAKKIDPDEVRDDLDTIYTDACEAQKLLESLKCDISLS